MASDLSIVETFFGRADSSVEVRPTLGDRFLERDFLLGPVSALERDQRRRSDIMLYRSRTHLDRLQVVLGRECLFPEPSRVADSAASRRCLSTLGGVRAPGRAPT